MMGMQRLLWHARVARTPIACLSVCLGWTLLYLWRQRSQKKQLRDAESREQAEAAAATVDAPEVGRAKPTAAEAAAADVQKLRAQVHSLSAELAEARGQGGGRGTAERSITSSSNGSSFSAELNV